MYRRLPYGIHLVAGLHGIPHHNRSDHLRLQARPLKGGGDGCCPSSTAGISFKLPPNVPTAVRTGSATTSEYINDMA
jgi:hypothetical protein